MAAPPPRLVWLLRHAKAAPDAPGGGPDHDRPLHPAGRRDAEDLGRRLAAGPAGPAGIVGPAATELSAAADPHVGVDRPGGAGLPSYVLCSSAARAVQTAEQLFVGIGEPAALLDRRRSLYYASPEQLLAEVATVDDHVRSVMVVGHNPAIRALASSMPAEEDRAARESLHRGGFPPCALAVFSVPAVRWRDVAAGTAILNAFVTPPYGLS